VRKRGSIKTGGRPKPPELKNWEERVWPKVCIINNHCA
jgi:hypothetical protein